MMNEVLAALFAEEVRDKKRTASGVHSKTGKRGYVGKMLFPTDIMSRKEKYRHRKAGKVEVSNMYDTLIPYDKFLELSDNEQRQHLVAYREKFTNEEIVKAWKIGINTLYKFVNKYNLPRAKYNKSTSKNKNVKDNKVQVEAYIVEESKQIAVPTPEVKQDGFQFRINGLHSSEKLIKRLEKIALVLSDEEAEFEINLDIREIVK